MTRPRDPAKIETGATAHTRAISQDLHARDPEGRETDQIVRGLGRLYTWNVWSPRMGITTKLTADGRTMLRASYGRFHQGMLTAELSPVHPSATPTMTKAFDPTTRDYTRLVSVVDPRINVQIDPKTRAPRTDESSIGVDRELGRRLAVAAAYVRKNGSNFISYADVGGHYRGEKRREFRHQPGDSAETVFHTMAVSMSK